MGFGPADYLTLVTIGGAVWGMGRRVAARMKKSAPPMDEPAGPDPLLADDDAPRAPMMPAEPGALTTEQWRDALEESPHLLIYGPSKAGKSTLAQAVVAMFQGCDYVVIDPQPNKPKETKWGGADFITLDETGADEYASIKQALASIKAEDDARRRTMRTQTHRQLVVIIDEVLQLVGALGMIRNEEGKNEPRMAHFIRTMGYSARHRNIKIILIGQGKNLADLGLNSGTARNNYALIRVARNAATNARAAYIDTDDGEKPIDLRLVPKLAAAIGSRARLWLAHGQIGAGVDEDSMLAELLGTSTNAKKDGFSTSVPVPAVPVPGGTPDTDALDRDEKIRLLVSLGVSANAIFSAVGGNRSDVLERIAELRRN